jgi:phosphoribosylformylglycinamidine synthase
LYHNPADILIKASNGASDFGNKFGQPLINGSLFTFEHAENGKIYGYDKVIMLAGGIGFANKRDGQKDMPREGDIIVVLGGDNYRIGMGGGAVSSVATGEYGQNIELNAVQRANPEMQKRVANTIRALVESDNNPIVSIHDHGAGGHLNSLSELVEETGAVIEVGKLPLGDPTLSIKEILGNESQERMGMVVNEESYKHIEKIASRERSPIYKVGTVKKNQRLIIEDEEGNCPVDLQLEVLFGKPPKTVLTDTTEQVKFEEPSYSLSKLNEYLVNVLQIEAVACKDWLTNKVDRSVTGKVAMQQCTGVLQLPLNNLGISALDYDGKKGVATAIGHAPAVALADPAKGSRLSIAEALTNIVWAPIEGGLRGVSLSANWMWPARNSGENARLYKAVKAVSDFAIELGINIPTGKDSLSMTQKYPDGTVVYAPGTVIISAAAEVEDVKKAVRTNIQTIENTHVIYIDFSKSPFALGGSSFAQTLNRVGTQTPDIADAKYFALAFDTVQKLIKENLILAGHDISSGGIITTLFEMNFANCDYGMDIVLDSIPEKDPVKLLFSENPGVVIQVKDKERVTGILKSAGISHYTIGTVVNSCTLGIKKGENNFTFNIADYRDIWYETSYLFDKKQTAGDLAHTRFKNYKKQDLKYSFPKHFDGKASTLGIDLERRGKSGIKAAIIREKGINGDREMAYALYLAGFDVKDVHMTDLISGNETLDDIHFIVFTGGFSNSDVLGSAKGWAGAFLFNEKAKKSLDNFYKRNDTLSLGVCNGCQLMVELGLIYPEHPEKPAMLLNDSKKFESGFVNLNIGENNSVMLRTLAGTRLGAWIAHGEGKFGFPYYSDKYKIPIVYSYDKYPGNPNGSDFNAAAICSNDGRHLAMMPHLERSFLPWQWPYYPAERTSDQVTPWIEAFVNAKKWIEATL